MTTTRERTTTGAVSGGWRAVTEHLLRQYRRIWVGSAISSFLTPLLYLGGMGYGLGLLVDRNAGGIGGVSYLAFIAPGVLAGTALQVAAGESTFPVMAAMKWVPIYFGMLASPLGVRDLVRGHQTFVLVRVATTSAIFFGVAAALGTVHSWWGLLAVPVAIVGGMAFATCAYAYAAMLENDRGLTNLLRFVVTPMTLFAGTYFPVEQLPGWLQPVAWVTPLWHAVDACRDLTLGVATVGGVAGHVAYLAAWLLVGAVLSVRVLRRRLVV